MIMADSNNNDYLSSTLLDLQPLTFGTISVYLVNILNYIRIHGSLQVNLGVRPIHQNRCIARKSNQKQSESIDDISVFT